MAKDETMKVLLAICDGPFRTAIGIALQEANFLLEFEETDTLESTLSCLRASRHDCIVVDFFDANGEKMALNLLGRMQGERNVTPVVVLTGAEPELVAMEVLKAGAVDYLIKARLTPYALAQSILLAVQIARERRKIKDSAAAPHPDCEEFVRARDAALEASRVKAQFLAFTTHELKTPLNSILGYAEMIEEDLTKLGQENIAADVLKIREAGQHLALLIADLLDLSKMEAGKLELHYEPVDVKEIISRALVFVATVIRANSNTVSVEIDNNVTVVQADDVRLLQILVNMLSNAAKFTHNGKITIRAQHEDRQDRRWLDVSVTDTGVGITPEQIQRLFEPYVQMDSKKHRLSGTGLGLTISRLLCWAMDGEITVVSNPGEGTTFTVSLPVAAVEPGA
ncbi:MAG: ATP-binding protein [Candidatus Sumerlaeaceae bacterium]